MLFRFCFVNNGQHYRGEEGVENVCKKIAAVSNGIQMEQWLRLVILISIISLIMGQNSIPH